MNNSTFTYLNTQKIPQDNAVPTDGKNLHLVFYDFVFRKEEDVVKLTVAIMSDIEHNLLYKFRTETYFESDNVVFDDELLPVMDKYLQEAYSDHYNNIIEAFKPFGLSGFDYIKSADFSSYSRSLSKALEKAKVDFKEK
jgi:hypothetical protein